MEQEVVFWNFLKQIRSRVAPQTKAPLYARIEALIAEHRYTVEIRNALLEAGRQPTPIPNALFEGFVDWERTQGWPGDFEMVRDRAAISRRPMRAIELWEVCLLVRPPTTEVLQGLFEACKQAGVPDRAAHWRSEVLRHPRDHPEYLVELARSLGA